MFRRDKGERESKYECPYYACCAAQLYTPEPLNTIQLARKLLEELHGFWHVGWPR